jgi:hypothetical protein
MINIYSKIDPHQLLHLIVENSDFFHRKEIISPENFLQLATLELDAGLEFRAHKHLEKPTTFENFHAQEAWVILHGSVEVRYFDLDNSEISKNILIKDQISITLQGGHSYRILENSRILEFKTGPYFGADLDKIFI